MGDSKENGGSHDVIVDISGQVTTFAYPLELAKALTADGHTLMGVRFTQGGAPVFITKPSASGEPSARWLRVREAQRHAAENATIIVTAPDESLP